MLVEVKLFSTLRRLKPSRSEDASDQRWELKEGTLVSEVLERLELEPGVPVLVLVNGCHVGKERELKDGDTLCLFPPLFGG